MKKAPFQLGLLLFFLVLTSSCRKEDRTDTNQLIGKWEWIKTINAFYQGGEVTPQSDGHTIKLEFFRDGSMKEFKDDVLIKTSTYTIETNPLNPDVFFMQSEIINSHFIINGNSLVFSEAEVDGPVYYYVKK